MRWFTTVLAVLVLEGCHSCTDELRVAITVVVRDAVTDGLLGSAPTAIRTDGQYREVLDEALADSASAAHELVFWGRPGTYDVEVRAAGYRTWRKDDVRVSGDNCGHPQGVVEIEARMVPLE